VLALIPGAPREAVEAVLNVPIRWCAGPEEFLDASGGDWAVFLLSLDHEAVDDALAKRIREARQEIPLFLTSRETSIERVIAAERAGAEALLPHSLDEEVLRREVRPLLEESADVPVPPSPRIPGDAGVVGSNPALMDVFRVVARVASSTTTVLITGESGTGKELVARAVHERGARSSGPFVAVNCAAIPDTLLEAELFGHEKGAFTGAVARSDGRFGRADGGTLFLDEVGEMSLSLQSKLLRVLESGEIERLGGGRTTRVDVRVVAATNRDLRERVRAEAFREDLLFRLAVVELQLPPLRDRREDVLPLAFHFTARFSEAHGRSVRALSRRAADALRNHLWPGNVRELRNVVDRAVLLAKGGVIRTPDLRLGPEAPRTSPLDPSRDVGYSPTLSLREVEASHIRTVLAHTGGHLGEAAEILGIHRNTMTAKVREYGIDIGAVTARR
jgi:two-component system response regulator HydG